MMGSYYHGKHGGKPHEASILVHKGGHVVKITVTHRLIRCKRIYNFLCSMLVLYLLSYVLSTLWSIFTHFMELTY